MMQVLDREKVWRRERRRGFFFDRQKYINRGTRGASTHYKRATMCVLKNVNPSHRNESVIGLLQVYKFHPVIIILNHRDCVIKQVKIQF